MCSLSYYRMCSLSRVRMHLPIITITTWVDPYMCPDMCLHMSLYVLVPDAPAKPIKRENTFYMSKIWWHRMRRNINKMQNKMKNPYYRMCSLSYHRMCSLLLEKVFSLIPAGTAAADIALLHTIECVLSYYRMCSLSYHRMCSLLQ